MRASVSTVCGIGRVDVNCLCCAGVAELVGIVIRFARRWCAVVAQQVGYSVDGSWQM